MNRFCFGRLSGMVQKGFVVSLEIQKLAQRLAQHKGAETPLSGSSRKFWPSLVADRKLRRIATACASGGLVHAAVCSFFFPASFGAAYLQNRALYLPVFLVMALRVVPTVA